MRGIRFRCSQFLSEVRVKLGLKNYSGNNQTILAYKGAALALQSKYVGTKESKRENFTKGVGLIENAIKQEPNNLELRIIRLSIQENTPKMMKYKMN